MLPETGTPLRKTSTRALGYALVGVTLAVALHVYFALNWNHYAASVSPTRMAQRGGVVPQPHIAATRRSARDGAVVLLLSGVIVALIAWRPWTGSGAFAAGAVMANVGLGIAADQVRGNLWPLGIASVVLLTLMPVMLGSGIAGGLRMFKNRGRAALVMTVLMAGIVRCASAPPAPPAVTPSTTPAQPKAELTLVQITPPAGTTVKQATVFEARLNYRLFDMKPGATYTLEPGFGDRQGAGYTFNSVAGPADVVTLSIPEGIVEIRYPIVREWTNKRLARPVELWFQLIETAPSGGKVIAQVGPYRYPAAD